MAKNCLYCGLQFADTASFCPNCGRPIERNFRIYPKRESAFDRLHKEMREKDDQIRQLVFTERRR